MEFISDTNLFFYLPVIALVVTFLYQMYLRWNPHKTEEEQYAEEQRKKELTRIISSQQNRELTECISEEHFWQIIEGAVKSAKPSYKARLGVLRDQLSNSQDPEGLLKFDNRYQELIEENINQDVLAAATLLLGEKSPHMAIILMNIFMMEGHVFFNNACLNPELIIGKDIKDVVGETIDGHVADLYFRKTNALIPIYKAVQEELKIPGEEWEMRDLPRRYPNLWEAFA